MKILFFMMPAHGHINPTLPVAKELVRRGEQVVYYTTEEFEKKIKEIGAEVRVIHDKFGIQMHEENTNQFSTNVSSPEVLIKNLSRHIKEAPQLIEQVKSEEVDGIVCDPMCLWGRTISEQLHIPRVLFYSGIVVTPDSPIFQYFSTSFDGEIPEVIKKMFIVKEELNIAPILREFQPDSKYLDDQYEFIGPSIIKREQELDFPIEQIKDQPTIFISLGSVIHNPHFNQICIDAFANTEWKVVMVSKTILENTNIPPNFLINPFVPQLEVLQHSDIFISHGGVNSVMESLWFGVPLLLVPQSSDQPIVAARVEALNLGLVLDSNTLTVEQLREAVKKISSNLSLQRNVKEMQSTLQKCKGNIRGADVLQDYFRKKNSQYFSS
ncbi:nucleotide disphospho-sugar-binding domain-containing protein [Hazenella coriacea]|uniref:MGT family glycosyltransferase n=1 Tax=Hazenella coriacea TaxID=1179467 RepID=A0A4R3L6K7_9BACL|nr:nucleotide disphospho-sugar-binding domain-containing protein [Hazenella coriacea]TCS93834.1 MGT family glycosyltransferase [Hazenella coriacea]